MKVIFYFSDDSSYESDIIRQGFTCQEILFNRLQAADGSVSFSIPFSTLFCNKMVADINNDVTAVVYDDNDNAYASGFVKKEVGYEQRARNEPIRITVVSKSYMLDKTLNESYAIENQTAAQIVTWLLTQAGVADIGTLTGMTATVPLFVFNAGENVKDVLKEFCFEYSKTFYFDKAGVFQVADLFVSNFSSTQTFNRTNIRSKVNVTVKEAEANCIRGAWTPLELVSNTLVFEDKQGATAQRECTIPIAANSWFGGIEDNFLKCDSTFGEVKYVKTITQNNIQADTGITKTLDLLERTSLDQLHFTAKNTTSAEKNITKMQVYADAYIAKENRIDVTTYGNKEKEFSLKYIQTQTVAQNFIKNLADYYNSTSFTVAFSSGVVCEIGDLITVDADGIGTFYCRIIQRTRNIITDTIDYVCENIGDYTPAAIVSTVQEPLAVNIAGGQRGLDGAPGADGKNAITMTSATTPSGEYNGQIGFWQGQPYMWNGSSWVKQIGDLPTDAVLHYSFDEVPDYPDGTAIERYNKDFTTNDWLTLYANVSVTNGVLKAQADSVSRSVLIRKSTYTASNFSNKILKARIKVHSVSTDDAIFRVVGDYVFASKTFTSADFDKWIDLTLWIGTCTSVCYIGIYFGSGSTDNYFELETLYIGDGSYSTPIIDNANGQNNATNNGGIAVQGVSGKGVRFLGNGYITGAFPWKPHDKKVFTVSCWVKNWDKVNTTYLDIINDWFTTASSNVLLEFASVSSGTTIYFYIPSDNGIRRYRVTASVINFNNFDTSLMHVVGIFNGENTALYINGENIPLTFDTEVELSDTIKARQNFQFGRIYDGSSAVYNKADAFDDFQIFDRALSDTEVQALYQNKANTPKYYDLSDYIVEGIDDDGIISPSEKEILYQKWIDIYAVLNGTTITASSSANGEYSKMIARATTAGVSFVIQGGEGLAYVNATEALRAGLWTTANLQNMSVQTNVSAGAIDTLFNNYRNAYEALSTAIDVQNKATASALSIVQSNSYHQVPTNAGGSPISLVGTDNTIYLLEGESKLECVSSSTTLTAGKWKITGIAYTGCTATNPQNPSAYTPTNDKGAFIDVLSGMTDESAKRTFTISFFANNASSADTLTIVQSFAKAKAGADGSTYKLIASAMCVKVLSNVEFTAQKITGSNVTTFTEGYLFSKEGSGSWSQGVQIGGGIGIQITQNTIIRLCKSNNVNDYVDEVTVNIFRDGIDGQDGANGINGTNGTNTWYSSAAATDLTTSIALNTITSVEDHSVTAGDLIIANNLLFFVSAVGTTSATVVYKGNIEGDKGDYSKRIPLYCVGNSATVPSAPLSRITSTTAATTAIWTQGKYNTYSVGKYYYTCTQIEMYDSSDNYLGCSWSTVARDTEYESASIAKLQSSGQYIGKKSAAFTAYTASSNWDWFLATVNFSQQNVSIVAGNIYVWNGTTWSIDSNTSHLAGALNDMVGLIDTYVTDATSVGAYARLFARTLAVQQAFIDELMANEITVNNLIKSSNYTQATASNDGSGFQLGSDGIANVNILKVNGMEIKGSASKRNLIVGKETLSNVSTGTDNVAIGFHAGQGLSADSLQNIAIGPYAIASSNHDSKSQGNIAIGSHAGEALNGGKGNIFLGSGAGGNIAAGNWNVELGNIFQEAPTSLSDCVGIGYSNYDDFMANRLTSHSVFFGSDLSFLKNNTSHTGRYINLNEVVKFFNGNLYVKPTQSLGTIPENTMNKVISAISETSNQAANHLELDGGCTIQWGFQTIEGTIRAGDDFNVIVDLSSLYKSYYDTYYNAFATMEGSTTGLELAITNKTKNGFYVHAYNRNSSTSITNVRINWFAIGNVLK